MAVRSIAPQRCADHLDGRAGEDGDAVVGFLGYGNAVVAERVEDFGGKHLSFELLHEQDVGVLALEPALGMLDSRADGVDVPACNNHDPPSTHLPEPCTRSSKT